MPEQVPFRVGLSADFLDEQHKLIFPDFGLESAGKRTSRFIRFHQGL